jgi:SNF2 family DNA or RNA helicase
VFNWMEEARRFTPDLKVHVHAGAERSTDDDFAGHHLVITTYGTLRRDVEALSRLTFSRLILDEAQAIKNPSSATAKAARCLRAPRRLALSGTPIENHMGELVSLFDFLNPGMFAGLAKIRQVLSARTPEGHAVELVRRAVRPFVLRRSKTQVATDLPARTEQTLLVELDPDHRARYDELLAHYRASLAAKIARLGRSETNTHVLEALLRLRQAACHPGLLDTGRAGESSAKLDLLIAKLVELGAEGHRALVFSQFTSLLAIVRRRLESEQIEYEYLDGQTNDRMARVERFQGESGPGVFLLSLKAGGVGLNLTAADYVFILDPWWNPAAEAQAIDRTHRIGQSRPVMAYRILAKNTVEERVAELQERKRELVRGIIGDGDIGGLTREDLDLLLGLSEALAAAPRPRPRAQGAATSAGAG